MSPKSYKTSHSFALKIFLGSACGPRIRRPPGSVCRRDSSVAANFSLRLYLGQGQVINVSYISGRLACVGSDNNAVVTDMREINILRTCSRPTGR